MPSWWKVIMLIVKFYLKKLFQNYKYKIVKFESEKIKGWASNNKILSQIFYLSQLMK